MVDHHLPGSPPVALVMRRSARAKRISLRISQLDGRVTLTLPKGVPDDEALDFARSKERWIRGHLAARPEESVMTLGQSLPIEGRDRKIVTVTGRRVILWDDQVAVPSGREAVRLQSWLRVLARDRLAMASDHYSAALGKGYTRITLRDTRSRWGSCSSEGALMYSWRLILAPPEVLRYVAAHEVAHLAEMNHSPDFWDVVTRLYGPYAASRKWLHDNGAGLHRYRF